MLSVSLERFRKLKICVKSAGTSHYIEVKFSMDQRKVPSELYRPITACRCERYWYGIYMRVYKTTNMAKRQPNI